MKALTTIAVLSALTASQASATRFTPLGDLPGAQFLSRATDVSGDGGVVVGVSIREEPVEGAIFEGVRWTEATGLQALKDLAGGGLTVTPYAISDDGAVIVGDGRPDPNDCCGQAVRWTEAEGAVGLGYLPGGIEQSYATGVSADGSVIVGSSNSGNSHNGEAFRWTAMSGLVGLGDLPGGSNANGRFPVSYATAVSQDGAVVVGRGNSESGPEAFRWTAEQDMQPIPDFFEDQQFFSEAMDVSADGSVVVGGASSPAGGEAFRWTEANGLEGLGHLEGDTNSYAQGVSADGEIVVGFSGGGVVSLLDPFVWTRSTGMLSLADLLTASGEDLTGWRLGTANAVSADGRFVVGNGVNPDGFEEAWRADISGLLVPEPSSAVLALVLSTTFAAGSRERSTNRRER